MGEYEGNSDRLRENPEPETETMPKLRKRGNTFRNEINDQISPRLRRFTTILTNISDCLDILFGGNSRRALADRDRVRVSYRDPGRTTRLARDMDRDYQDDRPRRTVASVYDFQDVVFPTMAKAMLCQTMLEEQARDYPDMPITVGHYYDYAGLSCDASAWNYGWKELPELRVVAARGGGYVIDGLPDPVRVRQ